MASKEQIINEALIYLEEETTVSSADTLAGKTIDILYDTVYQTMMKRNTYGWTFARAIKALGKVTNVPTLDSYANVFALPTDYLMMVRLDGSVNTFLIAGNLVYSNDNQMILLYVSLVQEGVVSPEFATAVAYELAMRAAGKVTGKEEIKKDLFYKARESLAHAIQLDIAQMDTQQYMPINVMYSAFFNSGYPMASFSGTQTFVTGTGQ